MNYIVVSLEWSRYTLLSYQICCGCARVSALRVSSFRFPLSLSLSFSLSLSLCSDSTKSNQRLGIESQISEIRMVDSTGKGSEVEDSNPNAPFSGNSPSSNNEQKKTCADCGTTKTPLWRGGPAGPKSLCNACGIRSRKKKRAILGISKGSNDDGRKGKRAAATAPGGISGAALRKEMLLHRSHWKKLGEEEKAAVLLMSLSYGSVYA
ncbi:hypothetical protein VNO78_22758 [Psophocarpus tetragonolobus]|uniref:GATA-type domain-containing protein n=1 Tax=Psophocarpus tetragonolobus TaxID=3891 RepID=A0AAN9XDU0_PSOTE